MTDAQATRLQELWRRRLEAFAAKPEHGRDEIGTFGWWFASTNDKLPAEWLLDELLKVLGSGVPVDAPHIVIEKLADLAAKYPAAAIHAFHLMIPIQKEPGLLYGWEEQVRRLLASVLSSDSGDARTEAERVINELAARGNRSFDDLLTADRPR